MCPLRSQSSLKESAEQFFAKNMTELTIFCPKTIEKETYLILHEIENQTFRPELRYSDTDLAERFSLTDSILLIFFDDRRPISFLLVYPTKTSKENTLFLDTIAVATPGQGLGKKITSTLTEWAKKVGFNRIRLYTEKENEKGQKLVDFYARIGFEVLVVETDGNIVMEKRI